MSADQFVDAVYKIKFEKVHAENIKLRAEVDRLSAELSSHARALQAEAALSAQLRTENEALRHSVETEVGGTFRCPVLWCGKQTPHGHHEEEEVRIELERDYLFLASDGPLPKRAVDAAKLYRRALAAVQGIGPNNGTVQAVTDAWERLRIAKQAFEQSLFYDGLDALRKEKP